MNLKLKLGYLSSQKKIQFFQRHILSKAFSSPTVCHKLVCCRNETDGSKKTVLL